MNGIFEARFRSSFVEWIEDRLPWLDTAMDFYSKDGTIPTVGEAHIVATTFREKDQIGFRAVCFFRTVKMDQMLLVMLNEIVDPVSKSIVAPWSQLVMIEDARAMWAKTIEESHAFCAERRSFCMTARNLCYDKRAKRFLFAQGETIEQIACPPRPWGLDWAERST